MKLSKNERGFGLIEGLLLVIALTLISGVVFYVFNQSQKNNKPTTKSNTNTKSESKPAEQAQTEKIADLVDYSPDGIRITQKSDVEKLKGASKSFKDYMSSQIADKPTYENQCEQPLTYTVVKIVKDTFVSGGVSGCGGARQIWKKTDGTWSKIGSLGGQTAPQCTDVIDHKVPASIIETCFDESNPRADQYGLIANPNN